MKCAVGVVPDWSCHGLAEVFQPVRRGFGFGGLLAVAALAVMFSSISSAEYISDILYVPLRAGPGSQFRIVHRGLKTGAQLTVTEDTPVRGFVKVVTDEGLEGYIPGQYITKEQPARDRIPAVLKQLNELSTESKRLKTTLTDVKAELGQAKRSLEEKTALLEKKKREYTVLENTTAEPRELARKNRQLAEENTQLTSRLESVTAENKRLVRGNSYRWYLYGGGTVLVGVLLGLLLPLLGYRRKSGSEWV